MKTPHKQVRSIDTASVQVKADPSRRRGAFTRNERVNIINNTRILKENLATRREIVRAWRQENGI